MLRRAWPIGLIAPTLLVVLVTALGVLATTIIALLVPADRDSREHVSFRDEVKVVGRPQVLMGLAITVLGGWRAMRYFEHTRLQATRRQLARLGIGELSGFMPDAGSGVSTEAATERVADVADDRAIKKGLGVDITPP